VLRLLVFFHVFREQVCKRKCLWQTPQALAEKATEAFFAPR